MSLPWIIVWKFIACTGCYFVCYTENKRQGIWIICYCWYSCRKCCCWVCGRGDSTQGSKQTTWSQWHGLHSWNTGAIHVVDGILFNRRNMTIRTCIDATNFGNESRFINHACESNCGILLVRKGSIIPHVFFIAKRLIKKGEEITIHYGGVSIPSKRVPCRCGCSSCCGFIPFSI